VQDQAPRGQFPGGQRILEEPGYGKPWANLQCIVVVVVLVIVIETIQVEDDDEDDDEDEPQSGSAEGILDTRRAQVVKHIRTEVQRSSGVGCSAPCKRAANPLRGSFSSSGST
jgi:hypothetical protein